MKAIVAYLADHPRHLPTVAAWLREEFGLDEEDRLDTAGWEAKVRGFLGRDAAPIAFVALGGGGEPLGAVVLVDDLPPGLPPYVPRLAFLYVAPPHRRRGLGEALTRHLESEAARLGHRRLYLYATDQERLYARLGWRVVERASYHGEPMAVMQTDLQPPPCSSSSSVGSSGSSVTSSSSSSSTPGSA
jgi:predicted N-acetyltransferase YhbS